MLFWAPLNHDNEKPGRRPLQGRIRQTTPALVLTAVGLILAILSWGDPTPVPFPDAETLKAPAENQVILALSIWAIRVQSGLALLFSMVFLLFSASRSESEVRFWRNAWIMNFVGLVGVLGSIGFSSGPQLALFSLTYLVGKTLFVLFLVLGCLYLVGDRASESAWLGRTRLTVAAGAWGLLVSLALPTFESEQLLQFGLVSLVTGWGATRVWRHRKSPGDVWLAGALTTESLLFAHHCLATTALLTGSPWPRIYMNYLSFIDTLVELTVGLGCLFAVGDRALRDLQRTILHLETTQESLRRLVDTDPLTGLLNRRALRSFLETARLTGAGLVAIDLDGFKSLNDRWGHDMGDQGLRRLATELKVLFRPEDGLFRTGGDEFLIVTPGLSPEALGPRIDELRRRLDRWHNGVPPIRFSSGCASLVTGGEPEPALREADRNMYETKPTRS